MMIVNIYKYILMKLNESNVKSYPIFQYCCILLFLLISLIGLIISLTFLNAGSIPKKGIRINYPYVSDTWITSLIMFYSISSLIIIHSDTIRISFQNGKPILECCSKFSTYYWKYYYYMITFFSILLFIGYFIGYNNGAGVWTILLSIQGILHIILYRQFEDTKSKPVIVINDDVDNSIVEELNPLKDDSIQEISPRKTENRFINIFKSCSIGIFISLRIISFACNGLLLGGCYMQAIGYRMYTPQGDFVTITYENGYKQKILTQCVGEKSSSLPTIWVEVGGGGHSMSDLWGLRDYIQDNYNRRYCSYDMPGTGWSDPAIVLQPQITNLVISAMNEPGPFICLGSMDDGDQRCNIFCSENPTMCAAVVPVSFGSPAEFQLYCNYYGCSYDEQVALTKQTCLERMTIGNIINFFGVSWGLVKSIITNPSYVPSTLAHQSLFLNVLNEKQWSTNSAILYECSKDPLSSLGWIGNSSWFDSSYSLSQNIPVFGFTLGMTTEQLNERCSNYGYALNSQDCNYLFYTYNYIISLDKAIIARNPLSQLTICYDECVAANGNGFLINQESMIPWFADTLFGILTANNM